MVAELDPTWTAMIVFYCLLFSVALLLFTCLCILCKRKKRKTRDVNHILGQSTVAPGDDRERDGRGRSTSIADSVAGLCGDVESSDSTQSSHPVSPVPTIAAHVTGQINIVFESDDMTLPPEYEEALKSKYARVYPILYPTSGIHRSSLTPSTSSVEDSVETDLRPDSVESPPPPYDVAVRYIDLEEHP